MANEAPGTNLLAHERDGRLLVDVQVQPRASRSGIVGVVGDRLKIALAAPPVDGAANEALIELLSELFGVPKRQIEIARGQTGRKKTVSIQGGTLAALHAMVKKA